MDSTDKPQSSSRFTVISDLHISNSLLQKSDNEKQSQPKPQQSSSSKASLSSDEGKDGPKSADNELSSKYAASSFAEQQQPNSYVNKKETSSHGSSDNVTIGLLHEAYEAKLKQQKVEWHSQVKALEELNDRLLKKASTKLADKVDHLQKLHFPRKESSSAYAESPCQLAECSVKECYIKNGAKRPLLCSNQVKEFSECVRLMAFKFIEGTTSTSPSHWEVYSAQKQDTYYCVYWI